MLNQTIRAVNFRGSLSLPTEKEENMKGMMLVLSVAAALCACSSTRDVYTSEGAVVYAISCQLQSYDSCIEKAGELCGTLGYRFVLADGSPAPAPALPAAPAPAAAPAADAAFPAGDATAPATPSAGFSLSRKYYVRCHS